jgi:glycosyltransferase involved in cell wall biosynthesis
MKILWVGDSPTVNTGFGIVSKHILKQLHSRGHQITVLGVNHHGEPYNREEYPYDIHPCGDGGGPDSVFGFGRLWNILPKVQPDVLFLFNDPWIIESYLNHRPDNISAPYLKTIGYYPIDAGPIKPDTAETLTKKLDAQICYSHFAERIIIEANKGKRPDNLYQIYHGVDTHIYKPLNQQAVRKELGIPLDAWVVGMVARNQYRKRFDILMSAFAKFAKDKDDVKLYLHTVTRDVGYDIADLISNQFNLGGKIILTADMDSPAQGVPEDMLNLIYNAFDVNALISLGDGFGLPVAESMATGCPQIVSDHSCLKELVEGHGGLTVKTGAWLLHTAGINTWGGLTDEADLAKKLQWAYSHKDIMRKYGEEGYKYITQDQFSWNHIGDQFQDIISKLFHIIN